MARLPGLGDGTLERFHTLVRPVALRMAQVDDGIGGRPTRREFAERGAGNRLIVDGDAGEAPPGRCLRAVDEDGGQPAVKFDGKITWTVAALDDESERVSHANGLAKFTRQRVLP